VQEQSQDLLRFSTAGSVDDGKSTLIGRLLFDSKAVYEDQLQSAAKASAGRNAGPIDLSLLTDGLRAEREQGITIDVAYRYFATARRKFIIADTPGHEQYTRNMATGASTAQLAVVLVDARKGVLPQSRRHAYIASLLGIRDVVVAVNKMDLVGFSREVFDEITAAFTEFAQPLRLRRLDFVPVSALEGDNVVTRSARTPWYEGPPLLEYLETAQVEDNTSPGSFRFPVQYVIRPNLDFRGYAGQIVSGAVRRGDPVLALPSGRVSHIKTISTWEGDLGEAFVPMAVTLTLEDELDVSRGDMLVHPGSLPHVSRRFEASLVWMHENGIAAERPYLLKHTTQQVRATLKVRHAVDVGTLTPRAASSLSLNEIGVVAVETHRPLFFDPYEETRGTGAFILIDPMNNATVGAGMISAQVREHGGQRPALGGIDVDTSRVTPGERLARFGHRPAAVWLTARKEVAYGAERLLFDRGCMVHVLADDTESDLMPELARAATAAGLIVLCSAASGDPESRDRTRQLTGAGEFVEIEPEGLAPDDELAARQVVRAIEQRGVLPAALLDSGEGI
jgi:sulfate adenylyltransferase large subunit